MSERNGQCVCGASIPQVERSPGIWRPLLCQDCLADEITRLGRVVTLDIGPWRIYRPGQLGLCPGEKRLRGGGGLVPCTVVIGRVTPRTILRVRVLHDGDATQGPSLLVDCPTCLERVEVQTLEQPQLVA